MRHSIAILFILILGCSVAAINFTGPAYAVYGGGANDDKGGGGDGGVQTLLVVTNVNLTSKDMKNIAQAFQDGKSTVALTRASGETYTVHKDYWDTFMPYEPGLTRRILSMLNNLKPYDVASLKHYVKFLSKSLKRLHFKVSVAKKVGTPAQVIIIKKMITSLAFEMVSKRFDIRDLEGK